jgi:hypothetical protein
MTHPGDDQLAAYAIGEADAAEIAVMELHLVECARCREELATLRRLLDASADVEMPFRDDGYGARVWAKLEPHLPYAKRRVQTASWRSWPLAAAAVFLIAIGAFLMGRWSLGPKAPEVASVSQPQRADLDAIRERIVLAAVGDHLERTERGLVRLVNEDASGSVDISAEQTWARDLLDANRLYRQSVRGTGSPAVGLLLDQLEPVLLDLVHSPSRLSAAEFEALRARIDEQSLLFKVRVTNGDVRARERALRRPGVQTS